VRAILKAIRAGVGLGLGLRLAVHRNMKSAEHAYTSPHLLIYLCIRVIVTRNQFELHTVPSIVTKSTSKKKMGVTTTIMNKIETNRLSVI